MKHGVVFMLKKDLKEIKKEVSKIRHPRISKILESDKIDVIIMKVQGLYNRITEKLVVKYNLEDELKQGKIYTILFALIAFVFLIVLSVFFAITLNSIIGIGLIFSFLRQIIFCLNLGYAIIRNKGKTIKKYLANLFPNSKLLKEVKERKTVPLYEEYILYQINDFIHELDKSNIDIETEKIITIKLKEVVNLLNINDMTFESDYHTMEYKKDVAHRLEEIYTLYKDNLLKQERENDFLELKNETLTQIDELNTKVYVKKRT